MNKVGAFDAKTHFSEILERTSKGEEFVVTRHGKPVARVVPYERGSSQDTESLVRKMRDFRKKVARRGPMRKPGETWKDLAHEGHKW